MEWMLIIKNLIISAISITWFSTVPNWNCYGVGKVVLCIAIALLFTLLLTGLDIYTLKFKKWLKG